MKSTVFWYSSPASYTIITSLVVRIHCHTYFSWVSKIIMHKTMWSYSIVCTIKKVRHMSVFSQVFLLGKLCFYSKVLVYSRQPRSFLLWPVSLVYLLGLAFCQSDMYLLGFTISSLICVRQYRCASCWSLAVGSLISMMLGFVLQSDIDACCSEYVWLAEESLLLSAVKLGELL